MPAIGGWDEFFLERFIRERIGDWFKDQIGSNELKDNSVRTAEIGVLPSARMYRNANLLVANALWTLATFTTADHDGDTMVPGTLDRLVVKTAGIYHVDFSSGWDNAAGSKAQVIIQVPAAGGNGIGIAYNDCIGGGVSAGGQMSSATVRAAVGDYFLAGVYQAAGGPINLTGGAVAAFGFGIGPVNTTQYPSALQAFWVSD